MAHYGSWHPGGEQHFLALYQESVRHISKYPASFPRILGLIQRSLLTRSCYLVYFVQETERILILAVLDGRMAPSGIVQLLGSRQPTGS